MKPLGWGAAKRLILVGDFGDMEGIQGILASPLCVDLVQRLAFSSRRMPL